MKKYEIKYLKEKLQDRLNHQIGNLSLHKKQDLEGALQSNSGELSYYDNHPADLASETYEIEKQFTLNRHQTRQINEVKAALERIEKGSYGFCKLCGSIIEFQRLAAIPEARFCLECEEEERKETEKSAYKLPVETDLLEPPFYRTFTKGDSVAYDGEDALQDTQKYGSSSGPQDMNVNDKIDYQHTWYESHEDLGYVEDVESISNETYQQQFPDHHGNSYEGYVKPENPAKINYFGEDEQEEE